MKRREFNKILTLSSLAPLTFYNASKADSIWSLNADVSECCACDIPCPCNFGRPTEKKCNGNRLIEINSGYLENEDLSGIKFVVTFEMGKWSRIYIDNQNGSDQVRITKKILPIAFSGFFNQAEIIKSEPLIISKNKNLIKFSTSESKVEMKPLKGINGNLIKINGLPFNSFYEYIQYESIQHIHDGPKNKWNHSKTNGFTSRMIASG